jgi:hypothetical protein
LVDDQMNDRGLVKIAFAVLPGRNPQTHDAWWRAKNDRMGALGTATEVSGVFRVSRIALNVGAWEIVGGRRRIGCGRSHGVAARSG